jgi:peptidoglycan LD-endopeptidase LytH
VQRQLIACRHGLLALLRTLLLAAVVIVLLSLVRPALERSIYLGRLLTLPAPQTVAHPVPTARGRLQDSWHAARSGGRRHEGIDIFAARGAPVHATTEGMVLRRGHNRLGGRVVWVLGPGGQRHYYAHLDGFSQVGAGDIIRAGTTLGYVGDSGNAKGGSPHLHYGIYAASGPINPYPLLRARKAD